MLRINLLRLKVRAVIRQKRERERIEMRGWRKKMSDGKGERRERE